MGITVGSQNFGNAVAHLDDGDIERTAAEVVDHDLLVGFLIDAVSQRSSRRLVDDTLDVQTGDGTGVLGGLTLAVVEVGGDGNDGSVTGSPDKLGVSFSLERTIALISSGV